MSQVDFHILLPPELGEQLNAAAARGPSKAAIIAKALAAWFARKGEDELEIRFAKRLDSLTIQITRIERNSNILIESLSLLIRYTLTVTAPVGQLSDEERKLGRDRFEEFAERVAQQLATGRRTLGRDEDDE